MDVSVKCSTSIADAICNNILVMKENAQPYKRLYINLLISFVVMYAVMFFNVDEVSDIFISMNRLYMALLMVSPMCLIMIISMKSMYIDKKQNRIITLMSVFIFIAAFYCLRTQAFISDKQYMKAMIPHHSSAVMTSKHAAIKDPQVRMLADSIIQSQQREIRLMKELIRRQPD